MRKSYTVWIPVFTGVTLFFLFLCPAFAQEEVLPPPRVNSIAMVGTPKYDADFKNFDYVNPDAPKGGRRVEGTVGTFDSLNPFLITGEPATGLMSMYDPLMARSWDEPFTLYGLIAREVSVPEDRSSITFYLNETAEFADGHPITSEDVVYSYEMQREHGRPNTRRIFKLATRVTTPDAYTVRFDFGPGYDRETALIFAMMRIIPKHYWTAKGRDFTKTTLEPPLGSGPYRIKSFEQGRNIEYERIKNYWAADLPVNKGQYNFDVIRMDYYRDESIAKQSLEAGAFDLWREWSAHKWVKDYDFAAIKDGRIKAEKFKHGRPDRARFIIFNSRRDPFDDIRVRKAFTYAFDFEWLNKNLFNNAYQRSRSTFPNSELADTTFNPPVTDGSGPSGVRGNLRKAAGLLSEAGWMIYQGHLVRSDTNEPFKCEILIGDPWQEKILTPFIRNLGILGIKANIRTVDAAQYAGRLQEFDYDITVNHWINSLSPGTEQAVYWGGKAADTQGTKNYAGVKENIIDNLINRITAAETRENLVTAARTLDGAIMHGYYGIPLYYTGYDYIAYKAHLAHPSVTPLYGPVLETWWDKNYAGKGKIGK